MNLQISRIAATCPSWNKRQLNINDLYKLARKLKAKIHVIPLQVKGFYMRCLDQDHIYVDSRLPEPEFLYVCLHELGHVLLHVPRDVCAAHFFQMRDSKEEHEADLFAAVALIPAGMLKTKDLAEIGQDLGLGDRILSDRRLALERYGI